MSGLVVQELSGGYGAGTVLHDISFSVAAGEVGVFLGANGSGKTTLMRALSGLLPKASGKVTFNGEEILGKKPSRILRKGLSLVPQGRGTFAHMTVDENLRIGGVSRPKNEVEESIQFWLDKVPRLKERRHQTAGTLSGGEQQMLAIARAFIAKPSFVMLDEPSLGLAPSTTIDFFHLIQEMQKSLGIGLLIVEQNADLVLSMADTAFILESGAVVLSGAAAEVRENDAIRQAYLGM